MSSDPSRELDGLTAVVTGAAQGIGQAIVAELSSAGATVVGVDRDTADLSDGREAAELFAGLPAVDILVNNAGGVAGRTHTPIDELGDGDWSAVLDANLQTMFQCSRAAAGRMKEQGFGRIVTISSGAGRSVSLTGIQAYTAAKAAQLGLTRQLAHELGPFGITVNAIAPGFVLSNPSSRAQWEGYGEEGQRALVERIATRRIGEPEDIARGVLFLASPRAGWISGQVLSIDGGHSLF